MVTWNVTLWGHTLQGTELAVGVAVLAVLALWLVARALWGLRRDTNLGLGAFLEQTRDLEHHLQQLQQTQADLQGRLSTVSDVFGQRQTDLNRLLLERLDHVSQRVGQSLDAQGQQTQSTLQQLAERLVTIDTTQKHLSQLAQDMVSLQSILSNKQTRGAFGQTQMEAILRDALPPDAYTFQATLSNNRRPDCVVHLPGEASLLVIDAKFPLDNVTRWREATLEEERKQAARKLRQDLKPHVSDMVERYTLPGETEDMKLLYVPSEGVYADLYEHFYDVLQMAFSQRVMLVSPSLLMLCVHMMRGQIRDARMGSQLRQLQTDLALLLKDVTRLQDHAGKLVSHFHKAQHEAEAVGTLSQHVAKKTALLERYDLQDAAVGPAPHLTTKLDTKGDTHNKGDGTGTGTGAGMRDNLGAGADAA
jgi:DNA recombination protein RmuC